jgi:YfiH family protein
MNQPVVSAFQAPILDKIIGLKHGFFGRQGGVSAGPCESLNCAASTSDSLENVTENRIRACNAIGVWPGGLVTMRQVHGPNVDIVKGPANSETSLAGAGIKKSGFRETDALVTATQGAALGLLTADCAPVLLVDEHVGVIGAAHAGWRGALAGILGSVVESMETLGAKPQRITAVIGPAIGPGSYEVGPEFPALFQAQDPANEAYFSDASGQLRFDLPGYVAAQLQSHGVRALDLGHDTFAEEKKFFSYRRTTKTGESECGRQLSVICLQ